MLQITRQLARRLRVVFKHVLGRGPHGDQGPFVFFQAGPAGLDIRAVGAESAIEYRHAGSYEPAQLAVPFALLADCEGRGDEPVGFELAPDGSLRVHWQDKSIPRSRIVKADKLPTIDFPPAPNQLVDNDADILNAFREAVASTAREWTRYALGCICLQGELGRIAATDGRQILVQSGFQFPWTDELLVTAGSVFGCRKLPSDQPVRIGRSASHVTLAIGAWTIHLKINADGRFPKVDDCIPAPLTAVGRAAIDPADVAFIGDVIERLPESGEHEQPVTLDLNGQVILRAFSPDQPRPTEVVLVNSVFTGDPLRVNTDRRYLARAAKLGLRELCVFGADRPILARDDRRQFLWSVLTPDASPKAVVDPIRIESPWASARPATPVNRIKELKVSQASQTAPAVPTSTTPATTTNATTATTARPRTAAAKSPAEQAIEVRDSLLATARQVNELVRSLKLQKRQTRLVESTLASLKSLQKVAG